MNTPAFHQVINFVFDNLDQYNQINLSRASTRIRGAYLQFRDGSNTSLPRFCGVYANGGDLAGCAYKGHVACVYKHIKNQAESILIGACERREDTHDVRITDSIVMFALASIDGVRRKFLTTLRIETLCANAARLSSIDIVSRADQSPHSYFNILKKINEKYGLPFANCIIGACTSGNMNIINWFIKEIKSASSKTAHYSHLYSACESACRAGWFDAFEKITEFAMRDHIHMRRLSLLNSSLVAACEWPIAHKGRRHISIIACLVQMGADDFFAAMNAACEYGHFNIVEYMITLMNIKHTAIRIDTVMYSLCSSTQQMHQGHVDIADYFIKQLMSQSMVCDTIPDAFESLHSIEFHYNVHSVRSLENARIKLEIMKLFINSDYAGDIDLFAVLDDACYTDNTAAFNYIVDIVAADLPRWFKERDYDPNAAKHPFRSAFKHACLTSNIAFAKRVVGECDDSPAATIETALRYIVDEYDSDMDDEPHDGQKDTQSLVIKFLMTLPAFGDVSRASIDDIIYDACEQGNFAIVSNMVDLYSNKINKLLVAACTRDANIKIVNFLVDHGADAFDDGFSKACLNYAADIAATMLEYGARRCSVCGCPANGCGLFTRRGISVQDAVEGPDYDSDD
jgi:hypothetical protein